MYMSEVFLEVERPGNKASPVPLQTANGEPHTRTLPLLAVNDYRVCSTELFSVTCSFSHTHFLDAADADFCIEETGKYLDRHPYVVQTSNKTLHVYSDQVTDTVKCTF